MCTVLLRLCPPEQRIIYVECMSQWIREIVSFAQQFCFFFLLTSYLSVPGRENVDGYDLEFGIRRGSRQQSWEEVKRIVLELCHDFFRIFLSASFFYSISISSSSGIVSHTLIDLGPMLIVTPTTLRTLVSIVCVVCVCIKYTLVTVRLGGWHHFNLRTRRRCFAKSTFIFLPLVESALWTRTTREFLRSVHSQAVYCCWDISSAFAWLCYPHSNLRRICNQRDNMWMCDVYFHNLWSWV